MAKAPVFNRLLAGGWRPIRDSPLGVHGASEPGHHNLGMYRMQVYDNGHTTRMHWQIQKGGGFHYHEAEQKNVALPVIIFRAGRQP